MAAQEAAAAGAKKWLLFSLSKQFTRLFSACLIFKKIIYIRNLLWINDANNFLWFLLRAEMTQEMRKKRKMFFINRLIIL